MFRKNLFGDITAIYRGNTKVAEYRYDAWGNCLVIDPATGLATDDFEFIGHQNPFRYRGYYWDNDLGLYYLMSRYYDPQMGRFINADGIEYLDPQTIHGLNLYAYCGNNPIMYTDPLGTTKWWEWAIAGAVVAALVVGSIFTGGLLGAALTGAAIGSTISLGSQAIDGELNWAQFALDTSVGAITGLIGASAASKAVSTATGFLIGGASEIGTQLINGTPWCDIKWDEVAFSAAIGGLAGWFSGAGAQNAKALNKNVAKEIDSVNKVLTKMSTSGYSSPRYAKAAFTNVCNRLGKAVASYQTYTFANAMVFYTYTALVAKCSK